MILFILLFAFSAGAFFYQKKFKNKIYNGIKIGSLDLGGISKNEAEIKIRKITDAIYKNEIIFYYNAKKIAISPILTSAADPSLTKEILNYNEKNMLNSAYNIGRTGKTIGDNFIKQLNLITSNYIMLPQYYLNQEELLAVLKENFSEFEEPAENAKIFIDDDLKISIKEEKKGYTFDYEQAILELITFLDKFTADKINISLTKKIDEPTIKKGDMLYATTEAEKLLELAPIKLLYKDNEWVITKEIIKNWIILDTKNEQSITMPPVSNITGFYNITLNKEELVLYLKEHIAPEIAMTAQNAKFEIKDGKVLEFQESHDGLELDLEKNYDYICSNIINYKEKEINLIIKEIKANITTDNVNNLGIKEIIGVGKSNFKGSPTNRRHNIKTGAMAVNGLLIAPEENFSLVSALGKIDGEHGYLPELVIKGNKTIPEYGGGLCQIGTTLFRASLDSGLPITERQNHSYRVSYYEPAGTDATIYNPRPDMKFINDTGQHILIQTKIEGDDLIFEFWGAKDGRIVEKGEPRIYNIVKPGPTKIIETGDLKPGEKKCTEISHNGADAEFNYKVKYPNGEIKENLFKSHYKPWQAVCLVGKAITEIKNNASTTDEIIKE
ncbi:MAG: VanW family protein [bacterium]